MSPGPHIYSHTFGRVILDWQRTRNNIVSRTITDVPVEFETVVHVLMDCPKLRDWDNNHGEDRGCIQQYIKHGGGAQSRQRLIMRVKKSCMLFWMPVLR